MTSLFLKDTLFVKLHDSFVFYVFDPTNTKNLYEVLKEILLNEVVVDDFDIKLVFWIFVAHTKTIKEGN